MKADFQQTLESIEGEIARLDAQGISIKHLNQSVADLKRHVENIEAIEKNIDAVREEVIDRIKEELDQNKTAGRFSILGFWVGSIALVLTIVLGVRELFSSPDVSNVVQNERGGHTSKVTVAHSVDFQKLAEQVEVMSDRVERLSFVVVGLDGHYSPAKDEFLVHWRTRDEDADTLSITKDVVLRMRVDRITEETSKGKVTPRARLVLFANNRIITSEGLIRIVNVNHAPTLLLDDDGGLYVTEQDTLYVLNMKLFVKRIFRKESKTLPIGDDKWAVLFKNIGDTIK